MPILQPIQQNIKKPQPFSTGLSNVASKSLGNVAKAPESNIKPPTMQIPSSQVRSTQPSIDDQLAAARAKTAARHAADAQGSTTQLPTPNLQPNAVQNPNTAFQYQGGMNALNQNNQQQNNQQTPQNNLAQNPTYTGILGALIQQAQQGNPQLNQSIQNLTDFNKNLAGAYGTIESRAIPLEFQQGREAVLARQAASQQAALQGAVTQQQQNQGQQLGALQAALGTIPEALRYGSQLDPLLQQYAQLAVNGGYSNIPSSITQNPVLNARLNSMAQAIDSNYNPTSASALSGVLGQQTQQAEAYKSAHQQANNLQSQLTDLITTFGLNPNDLNAANAGIQKIAQNTSNPQYKILNNYLADVASRYSQILTPPGGSATDTTRAVASGMLDGIAKGQSIIQVMNALDQQAQAVIAGTKTVGNSQPTQSGSYTSNSGKTYSLPY